MTERSIISLLETIILDAWSANASDVHIDPTPTGVEVRVRVNGSLLLSRTLPKNRHNELIARLKILASLRTDEHFTPQDGRFTFFANTARTLDIRISLIPTYHGENAVLRLLSLHYEKQTLSSLGMNRSDVERIDAVLSESHGLLLATGPTGSGKTTTLYALMHAIAAIGHQSRSVVSIEDPIEHAVPGVRQVQIERRSGFTFLQGLRAVLRQDPDVIIVGEIRDAETAAFAVHAALTGHLVLSTMHALNVPSVVPRLRTLSVDPYLISSTLRLAIAQRLVRTVCTACRSIQPIEAAAHSRFASKYKDGAEVPGTQYVGIGCESCHGTGYAGRTGMFDVVPFALGRETSSGLMEDGLRKVGEGTTTFDELLRIGHV